ncbi:MAG: 4Fe-4S binding protein [Acidobacteria bacterium]|nr:4Fe-4S binding protein [Acidobacteriota bacterium]
MASFTPVEFPDLLRRMRREVESNQAIFDLPVGKWFFPKKEFDFSARHFSHRPSTPVGPAAGPHTQLAQNIVLSWLAGGRIIELKTVQVNDQLEIPRPCIHIPNVGYNVEWSQELRVPESLMEYAKAVYLIEILKQTRGFAAFADASGFESGVETVYDISIGYDLEGIRSEKVTGFLRSLRSPAPHFTELRRQLTGDLREFHDLELPASVSDCVTLSTFHGCPADQIEAIARYLLQELGFNTIIKFNPTLLGFDAVGELLRDRLGYHHLLLRREAFEYDLQYDDGLEMLRRLRAVAQSCGLTVGAKFTNTLLVANNAEFFPTQTDPYMYLSGPPLHVISMNLMQRFREDLGFEFPVSFSAGIDRKNFAAAVACGMVPVTTCTDLLRQGGFWRLPRYLSNLAEEMRRCGVVSCEAYVLAERRHGAQAVAETLRSTSGGADVWDREGPRLTAIAREHPNDLPQALRQVAVTAGLDAEAIVLQATRVAGRLNGRDIVPALVDDPRYHAQANRKEPARIDRTLHLYDCINCDLCIYACPNDAIFAYEAKPVEKPTEQVRLLPDGRLEREPGKGFTIRKQHQLAVVQALCNECSNCEVYCPEAGAPFKVKERVFLTLGNFRADRSLDGFCREDSVLHARLGGLELLLEPQPERNRAVVRGESFRLELRWDTFEVQNVRLTGPRSAEISLDSSLLWRMKTVWESIFNSGRPNMVNPDPRAGQGGRPAQEERPAGSRV